MTNLEEILKRLDEVVIGIQNTNALRSSDLARLSWQIRRELERLIARVELERKLWVTAIVEVLERPESIDVIGETNNAVREALIPVAALRAENSRLIAAINELKRAAIRRSGAASFEESFGGWDPTEETAEAAIKRLIAERDAHRKALTDIATTVDPAADDCENCSTDILAAIRAGAEACIKLAAAEKRAEAAEDREKKLREALQAAKSALRLAELRDFSGLEQDELEEAQQNSAARYRTAILAIDAALAAPKDVTEAGG